MFVFAPVSGSHIPEAVARLNQSGTSIIFEDIHPEFRPFFEALTDKGVNHSGKRFCVGDKHFLSAFEDVFCAGSYMFLHPEATLQSEPLGSVQVA